MTDLTHEHDEQMKLDLLARDFRATVADLPHVEEWFDSVEATLNRRPVALLIVSVDEFEPVVSLDPRLDRESRIRAPEGAYDALRHGLGHGSPWYQLGAQPDTYFAMIGGGR